MKKMIDIIYYHDLVSAINSTNSGIPLDNINYNTLLYADDILIMSTTPRGLQTLINVACNEITKIGLQFNAKKTFCQLNGQAEFTHEPKW